jgi:hypothetical protein
VAQKKPRRASRSVRVEEVGRGCVYNNREYSREPGFFAIAVEKFFSFRVDWHQLDRAKPLVQQYQTVLDSVLQSHSELQGCVAYCTDCGIRFLTHPRNAGRRNLRCPFGCREHHRRQCSCRRSTAYYQTAAGKAKKKRLNGRRQGSQVPPTMPPQPDLDPQGTPPDLRPASGHPGVLPTSDASPVTVQPQREGMVLDETSVANSPMLPYVRMVVSLIEGVEFTCREVVHLLWQSLRQHSIGARRRVDYLLSFLHRHPP